MKYVIDCHTHTIVSGHAYTTLLENIKEASKKGIKVLGSTEHGPEMPGGPHLFYFSNFKVIPREICGVKVLRGCEANILDSKGNLDIPERILQKLDIVIASLHDVCIEPASIDKNTEALLNVMDNPYIHIIGHPGNPMFPIHAEEVVKKAVEKNILIEINNSSFLGSRVGSKENCKNIAILCKKYGAKVIINSDSHISYSIGDFKVADEMFKEIQMPEELIINTDENKIISFLHSKGKVLDIELD